MNFIQKKFGAFSAAVMLMFLLSSQLLSQGLDPATIANPPADSWPTYHGEYSGRRHSKLSQITPENVGSLTLAWAFQTNHAGGISASPLLVNGILYFTLPDNVWAVDARTGHQVWHYTYPRTRVCTSDTAAAPPTKNESIHDSGRPRDLS